METVNSLTVAIRRLAADQALIGLAHISVDSGDISRLRDAALGAERRDALAYELKRYQAKPDGSGRQKKAAKLGKAAKQIKPRRSGRHCASQQPLPVAEQLAQGIRFSASLRTFRTSSASSRTHVNASLKLSAQICSVLRAGVAVTTLAKVCMMAPRVNT